LYWIAPFSLIIYTIFVYTNIIMLKIFNRLKVFLCKTYIRTCTVYDLQKGRKQAGFGLLPLSLKKMKIDSLCKTGAAVLNVERLQYKRTTHIAMARGDRVARAEDVEKTLERFSPQQVQRMAMF
jgi:hypothetical protein